MSKLKTNIVVIVLVLLIFLTSKILKNKYIWVHKRVHSSSFLDKNLLFLIPLKDNANNFSAKIISNYFIAAADAYVWMVCTFEKILTFANFFLWIFINKNELRWIICPEKLMQGLTWAKLGLMRVKYYLSQVMKSI